MNRSGFIKSVLAGAAAVGLSAVDVKAEKETFIKETGVNPDDLGLAIDLSALSNVGVDGPAGKKITPKEILELYYQTGILIYRTPYEQIGNAGYKPVTVIPHGPKAKARAKNRVKT